jgi:DNA-binding CsgD family transcriptional regulator/tetratricopeptide (TPR) repeat protein
VLSAAPGIGKSRLAGEALALARSAGFDTFVGHSGELGTGIAYAPFVEAFGPYLRGLQAEERGQLLRGLSQLSLVIGGLGVRGPRALGDPALERVRIVDGFVRLIERLTRQAPVVLLLEDVHVLDGESAALLGTLALTVDDKPLLVILSTRSNEPHGEQLNRLLAGISSATWWQNRIEIPPLTEAGSERLLDDLLGGRADADLVRLTLERCGGVPRLLESIAHDLLASGRLSRRGDSFSLGGQQLPLPADIRSRIALRLSGLTADERRIIELVALSGTHGDYALLTGAANVESSAHEALEHLEERMLVSTASDGTVTLAHGILREVVIGEMLPARQRRRHTELAEALQQQDERDPRIAEHLLRAGSFIDAEKAIGALRAAAEHARLLGANDDAMRYLHAAIDLMPAAPSSARADALVELGALCVLCGHRDEATDHWKRALAQYRQMGDAHGMTHVYRELAVRASGDGDGEQAREFFEAAERFQDGLDPSREYAELLYTRMIVAVRDGEAQTVAELAGRLRPIARRLHVPELSIRLLLVEAAQYLTQKKLDAADIENMRALDLAEASDDLTLAMRAHDQLSVAASIRGDLAALRRHSEASLEAVNELGAVNLRPWPRTRLTMADLLSGNWDRALRTSSDVLATVDRFSEQRGRLSAMGTHAWLLVLRGRLHEADETLRGARAILTESRMTAGSWRNDARLPTSLCTAETAFALAQGRYEDAARLGAPLAELTSWYPFPSAMLLGEALAHTDRVRAEELSTRIREWNGCGTPFPDAVADFIDGLCDPTRAGSDSFSASIAGFDTLGFPFLAARVRLELAERCADAPVDATRLATDALTVFDTVGAPRQAQRARQLLRALGVVPSRGRVATETGAPLSARELEVSRLVASGNSNAQIATALFISPRTVTTHLDHVYQRLGLNSRTALTRYLADSGLLGDAHDEENEDLIT